MVSVEAVEFPNTAGLKLYGTLHRPAAPGRQLPAIVLLSPGVKMRVGPGRLYVPLTHMLNELGYTVLRFDFFGLGDSEGELPETLLVDVYNNIEVGRYVDDTLSAMKWLRQAHGFKRFILGGLCGGAITALLAAERDSSVEGLLSLGMTVTLASNAATPAKYLTERQLESAKRHYLRKLTNPRAWRSFLTFKSNYAVIFRVIRKQFERKAPAPPPAPPPQNAPAEQRGNGNPLFPKAFLAFLGRGGKALMLFSEKDRLQTEYEEKFAEPFAPQVQPFLPQIHKHVVANANHVLALHEWQREMVDVSRQWMQKLHAA